MGFNAFNNWLVSRLLLVSLGALRVLCFIVLFIVLFVLCVFVGGLCDDEYDVYFGVVYVVFVLFVLVWLSGLL